MKKTLLPFVPKIQIWEASKRVKCANGEWEEIAREDVSSVKDIVSAIQSKGGASDLQQRLKDAALAKRKAALLAKLECDAL